MLKNFLFYLNLTVLCIKLIFNLFSIAFSFIMQKANQKRLFEILLLVLICLIWIFNFYTLKQKNEPQVELVKAHSFQGLNKDFSYQKMILTEKEVKEKMISYQKINELGINNLGLLLNLSELNSIENSSGSADSYFLEAQKIEPQIKY